MIDSVVDFVTRLVRSRVDRVDSVARSKMYNAQAQAKSKVSKAFNDSVDKGVGKAKGAATGRRDADPPTSDRS